METTMHQPIPKRNTRAKSSNNTSPIVELINQTPSLEQYVIANILTKCGRPQDYDGKYKFILYKGWVKGDYQYGRVNFYHKRFCKVNQTKVVTITS